jgi:hypothetical protein
LMRVLGVVNYRFALGGAGEAIAGHLIEPR